MLTVDTVRMLLDATNLRYCGSKASAVTTQVLPFAECAAFSWWQDEKERTHHITARTKANLLAYAAITGGRIPLTGLRLADGYFRLERYAVRVLVAHGMLVVVGEEELHFEFTLRGWDVVADLLGEDTA